MPNPEQARRHLIMRLINHRAAFGNNRITLPDDGPIWTDLNKKGHKDWFFGPENAHSLEKITRGDKKVLTDVAGDTNHGGISIDDVTDEFVTKVRTFIEAAYDLGLFPIGSVGLDGVYERDDLYGAVKAKLDWTFKHGEGHAVEASVPFILDYLSEMKPAAVSKALIDWKNATTTDTGPTKFAKNMLKALKKRIKDDEIIVESAHTGY